jgi:hypothetical protein
LTGPTAISPHPLGVFLRRRWADIFALFLTLAGFLSSAFVTQTVFEGIPHIEDEIAYVWQARALTDGDLKVPSPPHTRSYLVPFVVDYEGERFGKYPPGWPALLSLAIQLGMRAWINPLLAGLGVWLTYRLGKRFFNPLVGLLAAGLTVTSPFFLMNSGSLLSHPFGLVLSATFALCWMEAFWDNRKEQETGDNARLQRRRWTMTILAALLLGIFVLTRPMTALAVAVPFGVHGLYLLLRGDATTRRRLLTFALVMLLFVGVYLLWQYSLTGDVLLNPYTLWWSYDKVGFGPGHGRDPEGHNLHMAWINTRHSLEAGYSDLFGWGSYSWVFLPFGCWASRRNPRGLLLFSVIASMVLVYMAYWIGAWLFGPRYYYEGLYSLTLISAAGIAWLAGLPLRTGETWVRYTGWRKLRPLMVILVVGVLLGINLALYTPIRVGGMHGLYNIERSDQLPFEAPSNQAFAPALVIVHTERWMEYGALLDLQDPRLTSPFIFAWSQNATTDASLEDDFHERSFFHYYPGTPFKLHEKPIPTP